MFLLILVALSSTALSSGDNGNKEAWGYVNVRPNAYMFWWLYYTNISADYAHHPLIIWLQGGPGSSSCGYGNFMEIGPLDVNLNPRNETWLQKANLLFIDNPVGTGYSYVTNKSAFATTNKQIALDLVTTLSSVLQTVSEFQKSPLYIFSESYGGKMAVDFAIELSKAIKGKQINCNFKGIALGDSWISPLDSVSTWGPYLYATSFLDSTGIQNLKPYVSEIEKSLSTGQYKHATDLFTKLQDVIGNHTNSVDWYNILKDVGPAPSHKSVNKFSNNHRLYKSFNRLVEPFHEDKLSVLMNGKIREKLRDIPKNVTWGDQSSEVFEALSEDFMKPVVDSVDMILINESYIDVNVYTGQLDLIVDTIGTLQWIERLKWPGLNGFNKAPKKSINFGGTRTGGFVKSFKQFSFFWILKAGHMVPADAPITALQMVDMILSKKK